MCRALWDYQKWAPGIAQQWQKCRILVSCGLPAVTFPLASPGQFVHSPSANPPVAVVSCQWVSCLPAQLLPIGVQEQLGTALEALGCGEKLHSNVMCCLQLIHPAISVTAH